nr:reverse transcriptase domain-containing protein [Tanacetum cinerariifolium]
MAASAISISSDVPVAPEVRVAVVASPAGVLELDTHSSLEADPSESSPHPVSVAPMVSPFLCSDDLESDTKIPERHVSPTSHDAMLTRWRSRVALRSSSPTTSTLEIPTAPILLAPSAIVAPSSEFPLAHVVAPPEIRQRQAILIRPGEDIPIGRLYRTHPDRDVEAGIDAGIGMEVDVGIDVEDEVKEGLQDIYDHVIEIPLQKIKDIETGQRELEARSMIAGGEIATLLDQVASLERSNARLHDTMMMERARADWFWLIVEPVNMTITRSALVAYEATRAANALEAKNQSQNRSDDDNGNGGNGNGENRNGENGNGGNGNPNENNKDARPVTREELMKLMAEVYCPINEIQKMESELWNLTVKNNDLAAYTQRFQELTMMCTKMVPNEEDRVEKFIGGLLNNIQTNVIAAEPMSLQDAVWIANNLMDQKLKGYAVKNAENKRIQGDRGGKGEKSKLSIISCTKTHKYKRLPNFLAQVTKKETKDKSKERRLEDVSTVRDFSEVFPEDFHGLPPTREV